MDFAEAALERVPQQLQELYESASAAVKDMSAKELVGKACIAVAVGTVAGTVVIVGGRVVKSVLRHLLSKHKYKHLPRPSGPLGKMALPNLLLFNRTMPLDQVWDAFRDPENPKQFLEAVYTGPTLDGCQSVMCCDPQLFQSALNDERRFPKHPNIYNNIKHLIGNGLVTSSGALWHRQRKLLTPVFHFASLKLAVPTVVTTTREWIADIDKDILKCSTESSAATHTHTHTAQEASPSSTAVPSAAQQTNKLVSQDTAHSETCIETDTQPHTPVCVEGGETAHAVRGQPDFGYLTLSVIVDAVFSSSFDKAYVKKQWENVLNVSHKFFIGLGLCGNIWPYFPLPVASGFITQKEKIRRAIYTLLQQRKKSIKETHSRAQAGDGVSSPVPPQHSKDVLDEMVKAGGMSDDLVVDEALTFLFAGHDTTSNLLAWTYFFLGQDKYKHIQQALQREVDEVLGSDLSRDMTAADLNKLKLVNAVVKETLRIRPSVHSVARLTTQDEYTANGTLIPKDTFLRLNFWAAHMDARYWGGDAEEYRPERWLAEKTDKKEHSENGNGTVSGEEKMTDKDGYGGELETHTQGTGGPSHPYAYTPFSAGPRNCIGQKFAVQEAVVVIAMLSQRFDITNTNAQEVRTINYGTMCPFGLKLKFEHRCTQA